MNQDNYYPIEIKICSKNGWHTPEEARAYYGRYSREGLTVHWWGDGTGASNHDNIVNYIAGKASAGTGSVNYVLSDNKITLMVSPDNVAWASQGGNPTTVSVEFQPTLGDEGYKKAGWLIWQLEGRYGHTLTLYPHNHWFSTQCPGTLNIDRMRAEANKWASGGYLPAPPVVAPLPPVVVPTPPPTAPVVSIAYSKLPSPVAYVINKDTNLWNFNAAKWTGITPVKAMKKGEPFMMVGIADNLTLKAKYGMTGYSFGDADKGNPKATNGVNMADLDLVVTPEVPVPPSIPTPPEVKPPEPTEPDRNAIIAFLTMLRDLITNFLGKFK